MGAREGQGRQTTGLDEASEGRVLNGLQSLSNREKKQDGLCLSSVRHGENRTRVGGEETHGQTDALRRQLYVLL